MNPYPQWDQRDLTELLSLEPITGNSWRTYVCDANIHGQVSASQLLGQALWATAQTCDGRFPASLQMTFLHLAAPNQPVEFSVDVLRDGHRFSRRLVHGVQGSKLVFSANASFQEEQVKSEPSHPLLQQVPAPETLPTLLQACADEHPQSSQLQLRCGTVPLLDIRPIPSREGRAKTDYWMRLIPPLAAEGALHHAALAYLSNSWLPAPLWTPLGAESVIPRNDVSILNHCLWFHSLALDTNDWLLFSNDAVADAGGRSLAKTHIYQRDGRLVASMAQDLLVVTRAI